MEENTKSLFSKVGVLLGHVGFDLLVAPCGDHVGVELGIGLHQVLGDPVQGAARHPAQQPPHGQVGDCHALTDIKS